MDEKGWAWDEDAVELDVVLEEGMGVSGAGGVVPAPSEVGPRSVLVLLMIGVAIAFPPSELGSGLSAVTVAGLEVEVRKPVVVWLF